jgi:hypothetical protein
MLGIISQFELLRMRGKFHSEMLRKLRERLNVTWPTFYLLNVMNIDEYVEIFGTGGEGSHFFKEALDIMKKEDAVELVRTVFADKELTVVQEWSVVGEVFRRLPQFRKELREVVPLKTRVVSGDREIDAEMDIIFQSE